MPADAYLGVTKSLSGACWINGLDKLPQDQLDRLAYALRNDRPEIPLPVARVMVNRGLNVKNLSDYVEPRIRNLLPNPSRFKDLDKAAVRLADAVEAETLLGIFGDYDVDGASAAALLISVMRELNIVCEAHIPDRFTEGYGPNVEALQSLLKKGAGLILTVDCGVMAHAPLATVTDQGIDVIVIDHHIAGPELPRVHSVINPNRLDEDGKYGFLCAAGVVFILLVGLLRELERRRFFIDKEGPPDLLRHLDLIALATICDVVPLIDLNRAFVLQGLKVMNNRHRPGLSKLADAAGMNEPPSAYSLGFILGPRINAGGRIGSSSLGVNLLSTDDSDEAAGIAIRLDELNRKRKKIEQEISLLAIDQAQDNSNKVLILYDFGWHEGVIGIVASRVRERFEKPTLVISVDKDGLGKGSGRSVPGFRLGSAIIAAHQSGILEGGGATTWPQDSQFKEKKLRYYKSF